MNTLTEHVFLILLPNVEKEKLHTLNNLLATIRKITGLLEKLLI